MIHVSPVSQLLLRRFLLQNSSSVDKTHELSGIDVLVQLDTEQSQEDALLLCLLEPGDNHAVLEEDALLEDALMLDLLGPGDKHAALRRLASEQARQSCLEILQTRWAPQKEGESLEEPRCQQEFNALEFAGRDALHARLSASQEKMQMLLARAARLRHRLACRTNVAEEAAKVSATAPHTAQVFS